MKTLNFKLFMFVAIGSLFITSCEKNNDVTLTDPISDADAIAVVEADDISDDINNVVDDYLMGNEGMSARPSQESKTSDILPCVTKTIVITGTTKNVTLDFGEGCELPNGNILKGKIIMSYEVNTDVSSFTVTYSFENFFFNDISVEGENSLVRTRANDNGNPQSTLTFDMKVTWPDGVYASRKGTKTREWIEGFDTRTFGDNVFLITGNWNATFKDGTVVSANITTPLRREMSCRFIVSGVVELQKNDSSGTLDFGDGTCDNVAIFTNANGESHEITLKGRMF
ncbi:hypothetical protein [Lutibacter sp.]|uniref:hypothetical protein n=1 Tax=Lutibacter sp. TaxID=1925666 RepID=UPI0025BE9F9E|nr:hypothetical protein [Lutibacter sp.]MCF6180691.1 hypothetical protein [Lutibacter sp.]